MVGSSPASTYPFANNALVVASQVWIMTTGDLFTYNGRLIVGFTGVAVICGIMPYSVALLPSGVNYWVTFGLLVIYGGFSGVAQGTVFTMAANMPFKYMGAVMVGNGLSAICCNTLRAITLIAFPAVKGNDEQTLQNQYYGAIVFLSFGAFLLFMCVVV